MPRHIAMTTADLPSRDSMLPHARRGLAWAFFWFISGQLSLALVIELWQPQLRDPLYGEKLRGLRQRLASVPGDRSLVLMLGSSRTVHGFSANRFEQTLSRDGQESVAFNFGIPGGGPLTELVMFRRLLAEGIRPDLLLIEVFPPLLAGHVLPLEFVQFPAERLWPSELGLIGRHLGPLAEGLGWQWLTGWVAPCHTHRVPLQRILWPALLSLDRYGHLLAEFDDDGCNRMRTESVSVEARSAALRRVNSEYADILHGYRVGGAPCAALDELLADCRRAGIATALIMMPEGPTFQSWYPPGARDEVGLHVQRLGARYGATVIDARDWLGDGSFLDSIHLAELGAEDFSGRLGDMTRLPHRTPAVVSQRRSMATQRASAK